MSLLARTHRCSDCGFLQFGEAIVQAHDSITVHPFRDDEPASIQERTPGDEPSKFHPRDGAAVDAPIEERFAPVINVFRCKLDVIDIQREVGALHEQRDWLSPIRVRRQCSYFEPYKPLRSFREHLNLQQQRRERLWAAGGALSGAFVTAIVTALLRFFA